MKSGTQGMIRRRGARVALVAVLGTGLLPLWLALGAMGLAEAAGVVTDCVNHAGPNGFYTKLGGGGLVTFNCPGAGPIVLSIVGGDGIIPAANTKVDGYNNGNPIILSGANSNRIFHHLAAGNFLTLTNLTLREGNSGAAPGGCLFNDGGQVVMINVTVTRCTADTGQAGGGIFSRAGTLVLVDSRVVSNTAGAGGGLVQTGGPLTMVNSVVSDNYANSPYSYNHGGGVLVTGTVTIVNSQIVNNRSNYIGGGLAVRAGGGTITGGSVSGNRADVYCGGIDAGGLLTLTNVSISNNRMLDLTNGLGGGMCVWENVSLNNVTFSGNYAAHGGGFYVWSPAATARLDDVRLTDNVATYNGGAFYIYTGTVNANDNLLVQGNRARFANGGAIYNYDGDLSLSYATFSGNTAEQGAGGAVFSRRHVYIYASTLSGNRAGGAGGAIYNERTAILQNVTAHGNAAGTTGGALFSLQGEAILVNSTMSGNTAGGSGGGAQTNNGSLTLVYTTVSNNQAPSGGGINKGGSGASVVLTNTVVAYSLAGGNCGGFAGIVSKYSLSSDFTCALAAWPERPGGPNGVDPLLTGLGNYGGLVPVHMLKSDSPATDGVVGPVGWTTDARGVIRPQGLGADIGAVERLPGESSLAPQLFLPFVRR